MNVFEYAMEMLLESEGGLVDDPRDPGGLTNMGISIRSFPHLGREGITNLTKEQATDIYRKSYWNKICGFDLPPPVAIITFDAAVNSGVPRAVKWLQAAASVTADGRVGPVTISACHRKPKAIAIAAVHKRLQFLTGLNQWSTYGKGWTRRVLTVSFAAGRLSPLE